jgi:DNA-binding transcriptional ArsR family regulator
MAAKQRRAATTLQVDRPEQLKALGHPLRLKVLQALGEAGEPQTNRELAAAIGVDPGHLHFHVRMLHRAGLIELAEGGRGREKPYRAVADHLAIPPEFRAAGLATDVHAAILEEVRRGWETFGRTGEFRAGQLNVRLSGDVVRRLLTELVEQAADLEDEGEELLTVTLLAHPKAPAPPD